jgi:hypothetical protein
MNFDSDDSDAEYIRALARGEVKETTPSRAKPTPHDRTLKTVTKTWIAFCEYRSSPVDKSDPFPTIPTEPELAAFLMYCTKKKTGYLAAGISTSTLNKYLTCIGSIVRERHNDYLGRDMKVRLNKFIREICVEKGASTKARPRPVATADVVLDLVHFLWALDIKEMHPRMRLQLSCLLLIFLFQGIRPGAIVESSSHPGTNEGVLYKDLIFRYVFSEGRPRMTVDIIYRNQKGSRGIEQKILGIALLEDGDTPESCPVAQLMALAIMDGALESIEHPDDLKKFEPNAHIKVKELKIRSTHREKPVFRGHPTSSTSNISEDRIMSGATLENKFKELAQRAGYGDKFLPYCIRRAHGQTIDSMCEMCNRVCIG